jgi:hypothetical protein
LTHLQVTAIQVTLVSMPVKILLSYLPPSRPLIGAEQTACFGGAYRSFLAGDLNAKQADCKSRLNVVVEPPT